MPDGSRPFVELGPRTMSDALAEERHQHWLEHRDEYERAWVEERERVRAENIVTVYQLARSWTDDSMLDTYGRVNRLRKSRSDRAQYDAWSCLARACETRPRGADGPAFGALGVASVTEQDIEAVLRLAPRNGAASSSYTIRMYYALLHRLFDLAERPCRLRSRGTNPVDTSMRPTVDDSRVFSFLLPDEVIALLRVRGPIRDAKRNLALTVKDVLDFRILVVLGCYLGLRKTNLVDMKWSDIDLATGTFVALRTKTGVPIVADAHFESVIEVLRRWKAFSRPKSPDDPIVAVTATRAKRLKGILHSLLRAAGVTREILFVDDEKVAPIRFHDLRSTFVTWAKRAGLSDHFITSRTGHLTKEMVERYTKLATSLSAARFAPFPDVSNAIPELVDDGTSDGSTPRGKLDRGADEAVKSGAEALARLVPAPVFKTGFSESRRRFAAQNAGNGVPKSTETTHVSMRDPVGDPADGIVGQSALPGLARCLPSLALGWDVLDEFADRMAEGEGGR